MTALSVSMLLADGRFPAGGHAHSAGVEAAVADGRVSDVASLTAFAEGRLRTVGLVDAAVAMATATRFGPGHQGQTLPVPAGTDHLAARLDELRPWRSADARPPPGTVDDFGPLDAAASRGLLDRLDAEVDARIPAPPLRAASRRLGRQLLRAGARCWPSPLLALALAAVRDTHQSVAFGLVGAASGMDVDDVGHLTAHHAVTTPMQAGVRLLGLDPFAVAAATAGLATVAAAVVADAARFAAGPLEALPARSATLADMAAMDHDQADGRLFAT